MAGTDPEKWFLAKPPPTIGNDVVALVDGAMYMKHLYDRFTEMGSEDSLFYTAWRATPDQFLRPDWSSPDTRLQPALLALIQRGVMVRLLAWYVPGSVISFRRLPGPAHNRENKFLVADVRKAMSGRLPRGSAFLDERLPSKIASHHQKSIVLTAKGEFWAYVGGLDIAVDRWDTVDHSSPPERQRELLEAWHDVQCVIKGPAVSDIAENFRDRWNDPNPPMRSSGDRPAPLAALPVPSTSKGTMIVQRLRTLACNGVYDFKPAGEQSAREGINQAIDRAEHYVYLEDQYFWPCTTVDALARAVGRGVHVFLVLAKEFDAGGLLSAAHYEMRKSALDAVRGAGVDRVVCCHLEQQSSATQVYVHSKFMIVDDRFVTVGSANVGRRSHTTDSELHVSIFDTAHIPGRMNGQPVTVCKFAKELRTRVWNEHLNVPESALDDPIAGKSRWPVQKKGSKKIHRAVFHDGEPPPVPITLRDWYRAIKAIQELVKDSKPWPNATADEIVLVDEALKVLDLAGDQYMQTDLTEMALAPILGPIWWMPRIGLRYRLMEFIKNRLMNVETKCGYPA